MGRIEDDAQRKVKNDHFIKAFEYVAKMKELNQTQLAEAIESKAAYISKFRNYIRPVPEETIDALIKISGTIEDGTIYKPYLLGLSDYMLVRNVPDEEIIEVSRRNNNPDYDIMQREKETPQPIDHSSLVNAALAAKDETIASLRDQIQTKDELIASLRQQIAILQQQRGLENYPFKMGTAEPANPPQKDI